LGDCLHWVVFLKLQKFWATFSPQSKSSFWQKMVSTKFWSIFSQTHQAQTFPYAQKIVKKTGLWSPW
jgi:hypothetical protein